MVRPSTEKTSDPVSVPFVWAFSTVISGRARFEFVFQTCSVPSKHAPPIYLEGESGASSSSRVLDPSRSGKRAGILPILARAFVERGEAAGEQVGGATTDGGIDGVVRDAAAHHYAARAADVPGWGGWEEREAEAGERADGPSEEQEA